MALCCTLCTPYASCAGRAPTSTGSHRRPRGPVAAMPLPFASPAVAPEPTRPRRPWVCPAPAPDLGSAPAPAGVVQVHCGRGFSARRPGSLYLMRLCAAGGLPSLVGTGDLHVRSSWASAVTPSYRYLGQAAQDNHIAGPHR
ncbi:uncharacterized protein B0I36DRAFT_312115 [Microdochium trichocladiopsis]|uniref:Uncharacterized protein n=1 Tax=Microdochium trichocladiopsis TaxID=1682393 RepID=A0A9P9BWT3_9PEZI|nr:uncharacterized protein B0I36DRAFT_312115 [Microdochium trichocladiopsis]KAH7041097.1 hypothetical protein B0I36DRAFT_312115 [Microdochium trichocladiopsis]